MDGRQIKSLDTLPYSEARNISDYVSTAAASRFAGEIAAAATQRSGGGCGFSVGRSSAFGPVGNYVGAPRTGRAGGQSQDFIEGRRGSNRADVLSDLLEPLDLFVQQRKRVVVEAFDRVPYRFFEFHRTSSTDKALLPPGPPGVNGAWNNYARPRRSKAISLFGVTLYGDGIRAAVRLWAGLFSRNSYV